MLIRDEANVTGIKTTFKTFKPKVTQHNPRRFCGDKYWEHLHILLSQNFSYSYNGLVKFIELSTSALGNFAPNSTGNDMLFVN